MDIPHHSTRHRIQVCHGDTCPWCGSGDTGSWGGFSGRRRFRCRACRRTFSTFTGTPLYYLKRIEKWPEFTRCVDYRMSIRRTAKRLRCHPSTVFCWRHLLLSDWCRRDDTVVSGCVYLGRTWFTHSEKGRRPDGRAPRGRGYRYFSYIPRGLRVQVSLAWQRDEATLAEPSPPGDDGPFVPARTLLPLMADIEAILTDALSVPAVVLEGAAARIEVPLVRPFDTGAGPSPVVRMERSLKEWIRPFRGVATRYLPHYLQWFRSDLATGMPGCRPVRQRPRRRSAQRRGVERQRPLRPARAPATLAPPAPPATLATVPANRDRGPP